MTEENKTRVTSPLPGDAAAGGSAAPLRSAETINKWVITPAGDLVYNGWYVIEKWRLMNWEDLILHLKSSKKWIDFNDFIPAYFQALQNAGVKKITIQTYY